MVASIIFVLSVVSGFSALLVYRHCGPKFTFKLSKAITLKGGGMVKHKVKFPNFLPFQRFVSFSVTPLFKKGDVIEVDLSLLEKEKVNERSIRIDGKPTDVKGKDVSFSYIFELKYGYILPENKQVLRIKIDSVISNGSMAYHQSQGAFGGEWFWFREIYIVTLVIGG